MQTAAASSPAVTTATDKVTYSALRSGGWGVRGPASAVADGRTVDVRKKDGTTKTETIGRVIWTDGAVSLATLARSDSPAPSSARPFRRGPGRRRECGECGEYVTPGSRCWETGASH